MTAKTVPTRRAFLKGGALAAAPLAAAGGGVAIAEHEQDARLARLEDEAAIRDLHQVWLRRVNAGSPAEAARLFADPALARFDEAVNRVAADHAGAPDAIRLAEDGRSASGRFHCLVETQTERGRTCTLEQMAHAQGEGVIRNHARRVLKADYVKTADGWAIETLSFARS